MGRKVGSFTAKLLKQSFNGHFRDIHLDFRQTFYINIQLIKAVFISPQIITFKTFFYFSATSVFKYISAVKIMALAGDN